MNFAVIGINHGHIYGQMDGLLSIPGARCAGVCAKEPALLAEFTRRFPNVSVCSKEELLRDPGIDLIVSAGINADRGPLAVETMSHGKHFFTDKPPLTNLTQFDALRIAVESSGKCLFVYYSERLSNPYDDLAKSMYQGGEIGDLVHLMGLGPHRLDPAGRPDWMWQPQQYGGVLNDLLSHQVDWFCWFSGRRITHFSSRIGRFGAAADKNFDDFGDVTVTADNGITGYFRADWFTPPKNPVWGDVRGLMVGTRGTIEIRRIADLGSRDPGDAGPCMIITNDKSGPTRVVPKTDALAWPTCLMKSIQTGTNLLNPHDMLFHVIETTLRIQTHAVRVR